MKIETFRSIKTDLKRLGTVIETMRPAFNSFPIITTLEVLITNASVATDEQELDTLKSIVVSLSNYEPDFHLLSWIKDEVVMCIDGHTMNELYEED